MKHDVEPLLAELERHVRDRPHELAVVSRSEGISLSFETLGERVAERRRTLVIPAGEPVAIATGNTVSFIELFLVLRSLDAPVVSLDSSITHEERVATCTSLGVPTLFDLSPSSELRQIPIDVDEPVIPPASTALIKLTSGQTGAPKGVCFDEASLLAGIQQIAAGMEITSDDRVLIAIPLSHSYGFDNGVLSLAVVGTPLILQDDVLPRPLLETMRDEEVTFFPAVPPIIRSLAATEWPTDLALRRTICAAGPLSDDDAAAYLAASGRPVHQFYGCTESGGITFESDPASPDAKSCVGAPLPGVDVVLEENGRVAIHSAANFIAPFERGAVASPNVVYPGDTAEWTDTRRLRLTGRTADFLKIGGKKVHARELESSLLGVPAIVEAAVVATSDAVRGERAVAFVVTNGQDIDENALPRPFTPRDLRIVDELPYTARGKLDRATLRAQI